MPRPLKLKVYRMPIGFHDAYVAAPSQKAAAQAWGTDASVFSRGEAELVTDPRLMEEPLASPGTVVKRLRGTAEEQIAALGADEVEAPRAGKAARAAAKTVPNPKPKPKPKSKPKPRPSRAALDEAEQEMAAGEARHAEERAALAEREAELARERKALERRQEQERDRLEARREKAAAAYDEAMRRWRG